MLKLNLLGIYFIYIVYFIVWLELWIMFRKVRFVFLKGYLIEYLFFGIIIGVMRVKSFMVIGNC